MRVLTHAPLSLARRDGPGRPARIDRRGCDPGRLVVWSHRSRCDLSVPRSRREVLRSRNALLSSLKDRAGSLRELCEFARDDRFTLAEDFVSVFSVAAKGGAALRKRSTCRAPIATRRAVRAARSIAPAENQRRRTRQSGSPAAISAEISALGPGTGTTGISFSIAARTSRKPGSLIDGVPASETTAMSLPCFNRIDQLSGALLFVVFVIADRFGV